MGCARAISDGRLHDCIDDVMVHPYFRHRGVGTAVTRHLTDVLDVPVVTLSCQVELVPLYEVAGFRERARSSSIGVERTIDLKSAFPDIRL